MNGVPEVVEIQFRAAGWKPGRRNPSCSSNCDVINSHARSIFEEFGGLNVGTCGPGQEMATSNIHFLSCPVPTKSIAVAKWQTQLGQLTAVADAHNDHMIIYLSEAGAYYFFTDPDGKLYWGGLNFGEVICKLLLGQEFGPELEHDSSLNTDRRGATRPSAG